MEESIEYIEELVRQIRSVTQPVPERIQRVALSHNWDDVLARLEKLKDQANKADGPIDAIANSVKDILLQKFPDATLNNDEMANNSNVVLFKYGKSDYNTITISAE